MAILFGGPGGVERGLKQAQDTYGLAFKVVLVVEMDIEMATISRKDVGFGGGRDISMCQSGPEGKVVPGR